MIEDLLDEGFSAREVAGILCDRIEYLEAKIKALNARIAELEREQNIPDYRTLIRFPTEECSVL
jgi:hypothetical protein